ncbi:MAG: hypothetical protein HY674_07060, partial [Chloroflexi bacterium]|nr:hypothetical protein [Chloroflexota bacterium]
AAALADALFTKTEGSRAAPPHLRHELAVKAAALYATLHLPEREQKFRSAAAKLGAGEPSAQVAAETRYSAATRSSNPSMHSRIYVRTFQPNGSARSMDARADRGTHDLRTGPHIALDPRRDEFLLAWTSQPLDWTTEPLPADPALLNDTVFARRFQLSSVKPVAGARGDEFQLTPASTAKVPHTRQQILTDLRWQPQAQEFYAALELHGYHPLEDGYAGVGLARLGPENNLLGSPAQARWDPQTATVLISEFTDRTDERGALALNPRSGEYAVSWMSHSPWYLSDRHQVFAKVFSANHQVKVGEFELGPPTVHRSYPRVLVDETTGHWIFAYNYNFEGFWEIRGKVTDSSLQPIGLDSELNVCDPPLDCDDAVRTPGEFRLTRKEVEGNLGPIGEVGQPFNLSYHQATGRLVLSYGERSGTNPPALCAKTLLLDLRSSPPTLRELPGREGQPAWRKLATVAAVRDISQDLHQNNGNVVLAWTEPELNGVKAYAAAFNPATWEPLVPKHRVSVATVADNQTSPFVCLDQRTGNCLVAWVSDLSPGPETLIAGAADADGDAIADRSGTVSDTIVFTLASTAGTNLVKFLGSLDGAPVGEVPSTNRFSGLAPGTHTFRVSAVDRHGGADPSPALFTWEILTPQRGAKALATRVQELVGDGVLSVDQARNLDARLQKVVEHLDQHETARGAEELAAFLNEVRIYGRAGVWTPEEGAGLHRQALKFQRTVRLQETAVRK